MRYFVAHEVTPTAYSMRADPLPSYTAAMEVLAREEAVRTRWTLTPERPRGRVLLDLGSLDGGLARAIRLDDPVLRAIYELGYNAGHAEAADDRL